MFLLESNNKPVGVQLLTYVSPESSSSLEVEETPQFHKGILKWIEKMEQLLRKCEEKEKLGKRKIPNRSVVTGKRMNLITRSGLRNNVKKPKKYKESSMRRQ